MAKARLTIVGTLVLCTLVAPPATAQVLSDVIPAQAAHCALAEPPAQAGLVATPGGFVMMFPRNDAMTERFTGCKLLWVVDGERMRRMATLYFKNGTLAVAAAHDIRDAAGKITGACAFPEGKSLPLRTGQPSSDGGCAGFPQDGFYALRVSTWPRSCLTAPRAAVCVADPR